ncbi:MAG: LysM peptidoglycan-binding domain-containing protein, partial [Polyangiales bacterium]
MLRTFGIALLCLAATAPSPAGAEAPVVIVKRGDALSVIARRAGVSVEQLQSWNNLSGDKIRIGQTLVVGPSVERREEKKAKAEPPPTNHGAATGDADDGIDWT